MQAYKEGSGLHLVKIDFVFFNRYFDSQVDIHYFLVIHPRIEQNTFRRSTRLDKIPFDIFA